jgi:hypothetical protein
MDMPEQRPQGRTPSGPQTATGSIRRDTDELELLLERAAERGSIKGIESAKLRADMRVSLDQSQTISSMAHQLRNARVIIGLLLGIVGSVGGIAGSCARGYTERKEEILEPIAVAESKAERAEVKAANVRTTLDVRLDAADARVAVVEANMAALKSALEANTAAVLGIAAKLDAGPAPAAESKRRPK